MNCQKLSETRYLYAENSAFHIFGLTLYALFKMTRVIGFGSLQTWETSTQTAVAISPPLPLETAPRGFCGPGSLSSRSNCTNMVNLGLTYHSLWPIVVISIEMSTPAHSTSERGCSKSAFCRHGRSTTRL